MPEARESQDSLFQQRMLPSVDRKVSEIKEDDIRVRVLGTVVDKADNTVVVDDGTGKITATFDEPVKAGLAEPKQLVRVFGRVINTADGLELQGEVVQDMSGLDVELYKRISKALKFKD